MLVALALVLLAPLCVGGLGADNASAAPDPLTVDVVAVEAETGDEIPHLKWLINVDNSHSNSSVTPPASHSPVVASGDETTATAITVDGATPNDRGYLVSVVANDGGGGVNDPDYKIGGTHFSSSGELVVELVPNPLPLATVRVRVFHDNQLVNAEDDIPLEEGLAGFHVTLNERIGEVTTDWFGNPICTEYEDINPPAGFGPEDVGPDGPTPIPGTGGFCTSDADGYATIPNLAPNKFAVEAIPPDGSSWIQTTTIEGKLENDAWVEEGHSGFSTEEGFTQAVVWFGFVKPCSFGGSADDCPTNSSAGTATINGKVRSVALDDESGILLLGNEVKRPYVALNNIGGNDEQVYTARGNADGTFSIPNVPVGLYQLVMWDGPLDHIISFRTVRVDAAGQVINLGDIGIPRWFGTIRGKVYIDANEDGIRNPGEASLAQQDLDTRFKDGTIQYATFSDTSGNYEFPEVFELEHFAIAEVGYGRLKQTGAAGYETNEFGEPLNYPEGFVNQDLGLASLLQAEITWAGTTNYIDWGKKAHTGDENGGIAGIVFNAITRNELDASLQAAEDYEPGVPGVVVNLYAPVLDGNGEPVHAPDGSVMKDHIAATYGGVDDWYANLPTDCIPRPSIGRDPSQIQPSNLFQDCLELPALLNQIKSGVFDGGYAFEEDCSSDVPGNMDPEQLATDCVPLTAGQWIVEIEEPGDYRPVMEEDINVFYGDQFVPSVTPPPCAGPTHTVNVVDDPDLASFDPTDPHNTQGVYNPDFLATPSPLNPDGGSPYEGEMKPLCDARLVELPTNASANSDFFIFTDAVGSEGPEASEIPTGAGIQMPGRIRGVLLDDLTLELDPASPLYGDKRAIPNTPIGIRDFRGELITTVYSDENGHWEVLLPSTDIISCPTPGGVCPGMYQVVGNDPGTPQNPNEGWNPNYGTLKLTFDVWPGGTTYADVAILPITGFVQDPGNQFESPPICDVPAATPSLAQVSTPYGAAGSTVNITGTGFTGATATLDGAPITTVVNSATSISATIPAGTAPGPHQLLVRNNGVSSPLGITFHVIASGYSPTMLHVGAGQTYATIQDALDVATDGSLVIVHPGVYYESLLVDERVKLQGYGPGASVVDGRFFNFGGISAEDFAAKIAAVAYDGPATVPMGQVVTVLAENGEFTAGYSAQIDGFRLTGGSRVRGNVNAPSQGGAVYAHAYARNLEVSNNLLQSNAGQLGGGVTLGQPNTPNPDAGGAEDSQNDAVRIHHNRILNNGGVSLAGAIGIFNGAQGYEIDHNEICGNYSAEYGGGISNYGYSSGSIHDNALLFNYAFDEGGAILLGGEQSANVAQVSPGTGDISVVRNRIQGNVSNDDGGGIRLLQPVDGRMQIVNNMIVNNLATDAGGGIALDDALRVEIVNNTVARNVSTSTAEDAPVGPPDVNPPIGRTTLAQGAGIVSELHSQALRDARGLPAGSFSDPALFNNIIWQNESCHLDGELQLEGTNGCETPGMPSAGFIDLEVSGGGPYTKATRNLCTATGPNCPAPGNISGAPAFVNPILTTFSALAFGGDPTFVTVIMRSKPSDPQGDYHVTGASAAVNAGTGSAFSVLAPCDDYDGDGRPSGAAWDIGADEQPGGSSKCLFFSTVETVAVPGLSDPDNADIYAWNGSAFGRVFNASGPGSAGLGSGANVDAVVVADSDTFYLSFTGNLTLPGAGTVQNRDIAKYDGGAWSLFFDGDLVGLTTPAENIDAFEILPSGAVVVSTNGSGTLDVPGITGEADEDLLQCTPTTFGATTPCTWSYYLDSGDTGVGLAASGEDIDGAAVNSTRIYLTTSGPFNVAGLSGEDEDVFTCNSPVTGPTSSCGSFSMYFDGSASGITDDLDAIDVP